MGSKITMDPIDFYCMLKNSLKKILKKKCVRVWNNIMTELSFLDEIFLIFWRLSNLCFSMWCISDISHHKTGNSYDTDWFDGNSLLPLTKSSCCVSLRQIVYASHFMSICLQAARNRCHRVNYYQIEEKKSSGKAEMEWKVSCARESV